MTVPETPFGRRRRVGRCARLWPRRFVARGGRSGYSLPVSRRASRRGWLFAGAVLASLALHVVAVHLAPRFGDRPAPEAPAPMLVELEVAAEPTPSGRATGAPSPAPLARAEPVPEPARRAPARRARRRTAVTAPGRDAVAVVVEPAPEVAEGRERPAICDVLAQPERHPGCVPRDAGPSIDTFRVVAPGAVARSALAGEMPDAGAPVDEGTRISRALSEGLARQANARPHLSERPPPRLRRQRDGSFRYESAAFDAVVAPDGTVTFHDRRGDMQSIGSFSFDITDEAMRAAGQDPYVAERQWVMGETRELRERLADQARERERSEGLRSLERRLAVVWADTSRTTAARREAIFEMWDDCADDEVGAQARRTVERFVQTHLPEGSPDAYTRSELRVLNARRVSPAPFAPYG